MKVVNWLRGQKILDGRSRDLWHSGVSVRLLLQQTIAATVAWLIANLVSGHNDPFFAPLAAVVALNAPLGERPARQRAAERALDVVRQAGDANVKDESALGVVLVALRMVSTDLMVFAGVDPEQAGAVVMAGTGELDVPTPPQTPRLPFDPDRWRPGR